MVRSTDRLHLYDHHYFTKNVEGADRFEMFDGTVPGLLPLYQDFFRELQIGPGMAVLDLGCGRGEFVLAAGVAGATAVGIDFAQSAIDLAHGKAQQLATRYPGLLERVSFRHQLVTDFQAPAKSFDVVLLTEVAEHISTDELRATLDTAHRLLKPGGRILVYSYPNTWYRRVGYRLLRVGLRLTRGVKLPAKQPDQMDEHYYHVHINEMNPWYLRRELQRAGFRTQVRVGVVDRAPGLNVAGRILNSALFRLFFAHNLVGFGTKR